MAPKRRVGFPLGAAVVAGALLAACNAVLGINQASPEPSSDGGAAGDSGSSAFVAKDDCEDYCNDMTATCAGASNREYLSPAVCRQLCKFHTNHYDEQGLNGPVDVSPTSATAGGDSLYCRVWHAHAALGNPVEHCPHAGPLGAETCGNNPCDDFCSMAQEFCGSMAYASKDECVQACSADGGYPGYPYFIGDASDLAVGGDSLNCRLYHLQNFLFTGDAVHCSHIVADGGGVCVK